MTDKDELLKTDVLGRVTMPKHKREEILDEFERSGMTGQAFAAHIGVKYQTFASWIQKRRRDRGDYAQGQARGKRRKAVTLVEAVISEPIAGPCSVSLVVEAPGGLKVHIAHRGEIGLAVEFIHALRAGA